MEILPLSLRRCIRCSVDKPTDQFYAYLTTHDKICKTCRVEINVARKIHRREWKSSRINLLPMDADSVAIRAFRSKYVKQENGCWVWIGGTDRGYGVFRDNGELHRATAWIYTRTYGPIPEGREMCHTCDNPPCVNLAHIYAGTHAENMRDMAERTIRKSWSLSGKTKPWAKLNESTVMAIYDAAGKQRDVAKMFGVCQRTVSKIKRKIEWSHVTDKEARIMIRALVQAAEAGESRL